MAQADTDEPIELGPAGATAIVATPPMRYYADRIKFAAGGVEADVRLEALIRAASDGDGNAGHGLMLYGLCLTISDLEKTLRRFVQLGEESTEAAKKLQADPMAHVRSMFDALKVEGVVPEDMLNALAKSITGDPSSPEVHTQTTRVPGQD